MSTQDEIELQAAARRVAWDFVGDVCAESLAPAIAKYRRALIEQGVHPESADRLAGDLSRTLFNKLMPNLPEG